MLKCLVFSNAPFKFISEIKVNVISLYIIISLSYYPPTFFLYFLARTFQTLDKSDFSQGFTLGMLDLSMEWFTSKPFGSYDVLDKHQIQGFVLSFQISYIIFVAL